MLYYLVWDHPDNWQPFSNGPTLRFLFAQMNELAGVYVRGEPLNWWVCKLLEEIIVDNSEANRINLTNPNPNPDPNPTPTPTTTPTPTPTPSPTRNPYPKPYP